MSADRVALVALDDRVLAALRDEGPLTTGQIGALTGPHYETRDVRHGRYAIDRLTGRQKWDPCPGCRCTVTKELTRGWVAPRIRSRLLSLERRGLVLRLTEGRNNHGGDLWALTKVGT